MDLATAKALQQFGKILLKLIIFLIPAGIGFGVSWPIHNVIGQNNNIFLAISIIICINFYCFIGLVFLLKHSSKKLVIQETKPMRHNDNLAISMNDLMRKDNNELY